MRVPFGSVCEISIVNFWNGYFLHTFICVSTSLQYQEMKEAVMHKMCPYPATDLKIPWIVNGPTNGVTLY